MVRNVTLRKMGGSVGATLPKDFAERFHLKAEPLGALARVSANPLSRDEAR